MVDDVATHTESDSMLHVVAACILAKRRNRVRSSSNWKLIMMDKKGGEGTLAYLDR